jgi:DNA repair exonuclease SbcCD ATPase subunit
MWYPSEITIRNLLSHLETKYVFNVGKVTCITGVNQDDEGASSNGSGKSGLIEGINLAITGDVSRDVNRDEFIMNGKKFCEVDFIMVNQQLNMTMGIYRKLYANSNPAEIRITENGKVNEELTGVPEASKYIYEMLGINREDLLNYYIIGQGSNHSFFTANDTAKKQIISRFTNFTIVQGVIDKLDEDKVRVSGEKQELQHEGDIINSKIEQLSETLTYEKENFMKDIEKAVNDINVEITLRKDKIKTKTAHMSELRAEVTTIKQKSDKLSKSLVDVSAVETENEELSETIVEANNIVDDSERQIRKLEIDLKGQITCPSCKKPFSPVLSSKGLSITEANKKIFEYQKAIKEANKVIELTEVLIEANNKEIQVNEETNKEIKRNKNKIILLNEEIEEIENYIVRADRFIKDSEASIKERLDKVKDNERVKQLTKQLNSLRVNYALNNKQITAKILEEEELTYLGLHFGKKGFMTFLANKTIKVIEGLVNSYLKKFNTNLSVLINGYTKLKSGDIREKIDVFVVSDGKDKGKFAKFSGGEQQRINIAGILALQKLINISCGDRGLNLLCIDEMFDNGLDEEGQRECLGILQQSNVTTMVISHKFQQSVEYNIVFVKKNKITKLVQ